MITDFTDRQRELLAQNGWRITEITNVDTIDGKVNLLESRLCIIDDVTGSIASGKALAEVVLALEDEDDIWNEDDEDDDNFDDDDDILEDDYDEDF